MWKQIEREDWYGEKVKELEGKLEEAIRTIDELSCEIIEHPDYSCIDTCDAEKARKKYDLP